MPLTPEQIAAAGPWAVLVAVLIAAVVSGFVLLVKKTWVPGWIFEESETQRVKSDTQAERNADSIASLGESFKVMSRSYDRLDDRMGRIESRLDAIERRIDRG